MSDTVYLYGFIPGDGVTAGPKFAGVGGTAVEILRTGSTADAVISRLPAAAYDPARLEEQLLDLEWVAEHGVAHERVVAWFVDRGDILPVRLLTLYTDEHRLRQEINERAAWLAERLDAFHGLREWDLKVGYDRERLIDRLADLSAEIRALDQQIAAASPGRRFLLERKRQDLARIESARGARRAARELLERLSAFAEEVRRIQAPRAPGAASGVLNAALLVARDREGELNAALRDRASELEEVGIEVSLSGPWAPYRFLGNEESTAEPTESTEEADDE